MTCTAFRPVMGLHRATGQFSARLVLCIMAVMLALFLWPNRGHAQSFPTLNGRVVDAANLLSPEQKAALTSKLESLEKQSQRQLVVVTIPDLGGYDIADYGFRLGDHWGIGNKDRDDGALLIVAPNERKVRIEVGYGLEGVLTDALSARIIRNDIIPHFKQNDFPGGINAGANAIMKLLLLPPDEAQKVAEQAAEEARKAQNSSDREELIIFIVFIAIFFVLPMIFGRKGGRAYRGGIAPVILWGPGDRWGGRGGFGGGSSGGGGFSGGGGGFGGGGASGGW